MQAKLQGGGEPSSLLCEAGHKHTAILGRAVVALEHFNALSRSIISLTSHHNPSGRSRKHFPGARPFSSSRRNSSTCCQQLVLADALLPPVLLLEPRPMSAQKRPQCPQPFARRAGAKQITHEGKEINLSLPPNQAPW